MALIKCEDCGHDMSDKAEACPHCGCPNPNVKKESTNTFIIAKLPTVRSYDNTLPIVKIPFI